jgi:hypothetical protein
VGSLFEWQNLIFCIALLVGIALVIGAAFGLDVESFGGAAGADGAEAASEGALHGHLDGDLDGDADGTTDGTADTATLLALLGIGKAPLSVFMITLLFAFGGVGLCLSVLLASWLKGPMVCVLAGVFALLVARTVARLIGRYVPSVESYATEKTDVLGATGVAETAIDARFGVTLVTDGSGSLLQLKCRAHAGPIRKGREVLIVDYDEESDFYIVEEYLAEPRVASVREGGRVQWR